MDTNLASFPARVDVGANEASGKISGKEILMSQLNSTVTRHGSVYSDRFWFENWVIFVSIFLLLIIGKGVLVVLFFYTLFYRTFIHVLYALPIVVCLGFPLFFLAFSALCFFSDKTLALASEAE